jgi:hypothetical protein
MSELIMGVSQVLQELAVLSGKKITVEGIFVMKMDAGYMVPTESEVDNLAGAIRVKGEDLKKKLFSRVPAFGGSEFSYCDPAKITATLLTKDDDDFPGCLVEIAYFEIEKHGEQMMVIP